MGLGAESASGTPVAPSFREALAFWFKLGLISFGGPSGQIAIMHRELVERRRWISESRFLHALNYCMLLPGPEATQLATYIGWLLHRTRGGIAAGALFVLPSAVILWILSYLYMRFGSVPAVAAMFDGLKPAVLAIVVSAVLRIGRSALRNAMMWALALVAFAGLFFFHVPFPIVVATAGLIGFFGGLHRPKVFLPPRGGTSEPRSVIDDTGTAPARPTLRRALRVLFTSLALWAAPVVAVGAWLGPNHTVIRQSIFFSKAAMVTFGGAYAVLPYVSQQAVDHYGWLSPTQMLDGLGLAETTPGPLIIVLQFVGFVGAWQHPGSLPTLAAATLGAALTVWTTFVPCFLWIFLGAPHIEQMRGNEKFTAALSAVTAAVVGVILNLAIWFGIHVIFPADQKFSFFAAAIAVAAFAALQKLRADLIVVIAGSAAAGLLWHWLAR